MNQLELNNFKFNGGYKKLLSLEYKYKKKKQDYNKPLTFENAEEKIKPYLKENTELFLSRLMEQKCIIKS